MLPTVSAQIIMSFKNLVDIPKARMTTKPEIVSPYIPKSGELVIDAVDHEEATVRSFPIAGVLVLLTESPQVSSHLSIYLQKEFGV